MKMGPFFALLLAASLLTASCSAGDPILIHAEKLHVGDGTILSPGHVLIQDGVIVAVGDSVEADGIEPVKVAELIPGMIDAASRAGINRLDTERTREITPDLSTAALIDWTDREFEELLSQGTTTLHLTPGTDNVVAGLTSVVKTAGAPDSRLVSEKTGLAISMCSDPASGNRSRSRPDSIYVRQPTNRMGVVWMLRATFQATQSGTKTSPALKRAMASELPMFAVSRTQYDIRALLSLAEEFSFRPTIIGGQEAWQVIDELVAGQIPVILQPAIPGSSRGTERTRVAANMASQLHEAQVPFCLSGGQLLNQARFAVRFGLPKAAALKAVTSGPAGILKISDKVGSINAGKAADLVALSGDPLEFTTPIQWVMVDGVIQFEEADNR